MKRGRFDFIWNITRICGWPCKVCCVDAAEVTRSGDNIVIRTAGLGQQESVPLVDSRTMFDEALRYRQKLGLELTLEQKLAVLDHIGTHDAVIDFSGGDFLVCRENLEVVKAASGRLGRDRIRITATGAALARHNPADVAPWISELHFTYDNVPDVADPNRPGGYNKANLSRAVRYRDHDVVTRAEAPLTKHNVQPGQITKIYSDLHEAGIDVIEPMRLFPVGRGMTVPEEIPSRDEYMLALRTLRELEREMGSPKVKLQCALKALEGNAGDNPCDLLRESFGVTWDGTLLSSVWAINEVGSPIDDAWVLGNIAESHIDDIFATAKAQEYLLRLDENHGDCKIFSFLNSAKQRPMDRIFDRTDPLYNVGQSTSFVEVSR
jgi:MoaA/NifB/PqqE/SkfB family radical SAM enzyme